MENLSHEHAGTAHVGDTVDEAPSHVSDGASSAGSSAGAVSVTLARPAVSLADLPADAPPPALWSKLEAQLRREGIITS